MSGWGWAATIFIGWLVVSFVTAPLVGKWLRRNSAYYPGPPSQVPFDQRGPCVPPVEPGSSAHSAASGAPDQPRSSTP